MKIKSLHNRRSRKSVTWTVEPEHGVLENLQNVSRKLKVLVGPETVGTYKCINGQTLIHSFKLKMKI